MQAEAPTWISFENENQDVEQLEFPVSGIDAAGRMNLFSKRYDTFPGSFEAFNVAD